MESIMKEKIRTVIKLFGLLLAGVVLGFVMIVGVYAIPVDRMVKHAESAAQSLYDMQDIDITANDKQWCGLGVDTFTDSIIISTSICNSGDNIVEKAMANRRIEYGIFNSYENLMKYYGIGQKDEGKSVKYEKYKGYAYARYWNGYLVLMKPLLYLFDYNVIIIFNYILQFTLILINIIMLIKKKMSRYILPFLVSMTCICIITTSRCLQLSNIVYITLISVFVLLRYGEILEQQRKTIYIFTVIGMCVGYFDILTYPLVTLGMSLVILLIINNDSVKQSIMKLLKYSFAWVFGYGGIWSAKWVLASVFTKQNVIDNAIRSIRYRMDNKINLSGNSIMADDSFNKGRDFGQWIEGFDYSDIVVRNLFGMFSYIIMSICFIVIVLLILNIYEKRKNISVAKIYGCIPFVLVALMPFVWYKALGNHSYSHYFFTYRILTVTIFSILCMLIKVCDEEKDTEQCNLINDKINKK